MRTVIHIIVLLVLVLQIQQTVSQLVQCYANFNPTNGACSNILGEVELDDCCMNPGYGYQDKDSVCQSCRYPTWTSWSHWSACSVTCTEGVRQRQRSCYGLGKCSDPYHLGKIQTESCESVKHCPENGAWSEWGAWEPCSVTCERGFRTRTRTCSNPPPKYGGVCEGHSLEAETCDTETVCPTHGGWSAWGNWDACKETCKVEGLLAPEQYRHRTCTNPPPSLEPRGNNCLGSNVDTQSCTGLPFCPVNGNWGDWSAPSDCSVTCGVGKKTQYRECDNPAPKYGGRDCQGGNTKIQLCTVPKNCPVDGQWTEWSEWLPCNSPSDRSVTCRNRFGRRRRLRECVAKEYGGAFCDGVNVDFGRCYDIEGCKDGPDQQIPEALWSEWSKWSYCKPDCGENSSQTRKRTCLPDISKYTEPFIEIFAGKPDITCPPLEITEETKSCKNLPPC
ncbi:properdin-like [Neoarius graeffei]|uniref:properdin-like n=1 Tax=Neoarius graeffei TaxID=443677 RepID=UPI00298BCAC4|nr:properdin-like [Neoarius graeffei]